MWQICGEKETCGTKGDLVSGWKQSIKSVSTAKIGMKSRKTEISFRFFTITAEAAV